MKETENAVSDVIQFFADVINQFTLKDRAEIEHEVCSQIGIISTEDLRVYEAMLKNRISQLEDEVSELKRENECMKTLERDNMFLLAKYNMLFDNVNKLAKHPSAISESTIDSTLLAQKVDNQKKHIKLLEERIAKQKETIFKLQNNR